jgi:hypothetical protein
MLLPCCDVIGRWRVAAAMLALQHGCDVAAAWK